MVGASGPDHAKVFECCVQLNGEVIGSGTGHSKKEAEQAAAVRRSRSWRSNMGA